MFSGFCLTVTILREEGALLNVTLVYLFVGRIAKEKKLLNRFFTKFCAKVAHGSAEETIR